MAEDQIQEPTLRRFKPHPEVLAEVHDEADELPAGGIRLAPSDAPMRTEGAVLVPVKALEEAPDGYRRLDWSGQGISEIPKVPPHFRNSRVVLLHDNKLSAFPAELAQMRLMTTLRLDGNSIASVPPYIQTFTLLQHIRAHDNSIASLSSNIGKCKQLVSLDLQRNKLEALPAAMGACINLQKLWLSHNRIATLPFTFSHLRALKSLRVDKNQLETIGFNVVRLTNLTQLRVGHNKIRYLPENLGYSKRLEELSVTHNQIATLPPSICKLRLKRLALDENPLKRPPSEVSIRGMEEVFKYLNRLMYAVETWDLDLSNFSLSHIPFPTPETSASWEVETWVRLKILALRDNKLFALPLDLYLMTNLTILDIANNSLSTVPPSVGSLSNLQVLDASGNNIQALPRQMRNNLQLTELLLENNRCSSIPPVVVELQAMTELRLTSNRLVKFLDNLGDAAKLKRLHLEHNKIKVMPPGMSKLTSLTILNMSHNNLIEIPSTFVKIRPLSDPNQQHIEDHQSGQKQALGTLLDPRVRRKRVRDVLFGGVREPYRSLPRGPLHEREWKKPPGHDKGLSGLKWVRIGPVRPSVGRELFNEKLTKALTEKTQFTAEEWQEIKYGFKDTRSDMFVLCSDHFIVSDAAFWKPEDRRGWELVRFALFGEEGPHLKRPEKVMAKQVKEEGSEEESSEESSEEDEEGEDGGEVDAQPVRAGFVARLRASVFAKPKQKLEKPGKQHRKDKKGKGGGEQEEGEAKNQEKSTEEKQDEVGFFGRARASLKTFTKRFEPDKKKKDVNELGDDLGAYCRELVELDLSYNNIDRITSDFGNISTLTKLNLCHNRIERFPHSLIAFEHLLSLNLSHNMMVEAPSEIAKLKGIQILDLSNQGKKDLLADLPIGKLSQKNLENRHSKLDFAPTDLTDLAEFRGLELLKELRLSGNNFKYLPDCIFPVMDGTITVEAGMTGLRVLAINDNPLLGLDENLAICCNLEKLYVHDTKIRRLNKSITYMYQLREIWIAGTSIRKLDPAISTLPFLKKMVLSHEDQLDDYMEMRRTMRSELWSFLRPGEGEVAEAVAMQKFEETRQRQARVLRANSGWGEERTENDSSDYDEGGSSGSESGDYENGESGRPGGKTADLDKTYGSIDLMDDSLGTSGLQTTKKSGKSVTIGGEHTKEF